MRILMPSIVDPAARSGASTVTRNLIRVLEEPPLSATVECMAIRRTTGTAHRIRQARAVAQSMLTSMPAKIAYTYSQRFRLRVLERVTSGSVDLVMINGSDLLWLDPLLPDGLPRAVVVHNIEYELFASQVSRQRIGLLVPLLRREHVRLRRSEEEGMRRAANAIFLSTIDAETAVNARLSARSLVIPPMFGPMVVRPPRQRPDSDALQLGFLGNLHWWPNRNGVAWFLDSVLPRITRPVELHVFGDGSLPSKRSDPRVRRHGPAHDLSSVWNACDLMICPMRSGGGVSIKLAEAVFHGVPTLATPFATRGLALGADDRLLVKDEADWAHYLNRVGLEELRGHWIAEELSQGFTYAAHRARLCGFVSEVWNERLRRSL